MLVLQRDAGEVVVITDTQTGEKIMEVIVVESKHHWLRLGFQASSRYKIMRKELLTREQEGDIP